MFGTVQWGYWILLDCFTTMFDCRFAISLNISLQKPSLDPQNIPISAHIFPRFSHGVLWLQKPLPHFLYHERWCCASYKVESQLTTAKLVQIVWLSSNYYYVCWLVVSTPLKNVRQLGLLFPIHGKIKHVPNHQPVYCSWCLWSNLWLEGSSITCISEIACRSVHCTHAVGNMELS